MGGVIRFHRKEQWDLDCWPWLCAHWNGPNYSQRVFCIWPGGLYLFGKVWRWRR